MKSTPTVEHDGDSRALYLRFSNLEIGGTVALSDSVYIDVDASGDIIGIEILHATPDAFPNVDLYTPGVSLRTLLAPAPHFPS